MSLQLNDKGSRMDFIDYFNQDHCYLEDRQDSNPKQIASNVEINRYDQLMETYDPSSMKQRNKNAHSIMKCQEKSQRSTKTSSQQIIYLPPEGYCTEHEDLELHEDQKHVKPGDKFKTLNDFVQYLNENAKRWFYYYKCSDSRKPNTEQEMYLYTCIYLRNKEKYVKKGLRKGNNSLKTNCPCKIKLRHLPYDNELTVVFVCNHHDHPLSEEAFYKLQHGRRLPPYVKEEIMDLLTLQVDIGKIRKYVQNATGFNMSRAFFYAIERRIKSKNVERHIPEETLRTLAKRLNENNIFDSVETKRCKFDHSVINGTETSRSVRNLQESVKCETQHNPWVTDQCVPALPNSDLTISNKKDNITSGGENNNKHVEDNIEMTVTDSVQTNKIKCVLNKTFETSEDCSITYETFVSKTNNEYGENVGSECIYDHPEHYNDPIDSENTAQDTNGAISCEYEIKEYENDAKIDYFTNNENECTHNYNEEDKINSNNDYCNEEIVEYEVDNDNYYVEAKDAEVQTCDNMNKLNPLISVFDVCLKDGNVTGFVVNNEVMSKLKNDRVEKGVQTEEINNSDAIQPEHVSDNVNNYTELTSDGTYIKHEFIHKYNIDKYMRRPCFPKYIEVLSKKTGIDVLQMFTNVYTERAMFKMVTTQSDKDGNTRIFYVTNLEKITLNVDAKKTRDLDNCLKEILVLKETVRELEMKNLKLETINKQLVTSLR